MRIFEYNFWVIYKIHLRSILSDNLYEISFVHPFSKQCQLTDALNPVIDLVTVYVPYTI